VLDSDRFGLVGMLGPADAVHQVGDISRVEVHVVDVVLGSHQNMNLRIVERKPRVSWKKEPGM